MGTDPAICELCARKGCVHTLPWPTKENNMPTKEATKAAFAEKNQRRKQFHSNSTNPAKYIGRRLRRALGGAFANRNEAHIRRDTQSLCYVGTGGAYEQQGDDGTED